MIERNNIVICKLNYLKFSMQKSKFRLYHMTHKFDSENHLAVCKYSDFCFVYYLHILEFSGCPGEHLENQKCYMDPT